MVDPKVRTAELHQQIVSSDDSVSISFRGQQLDVPRIRIPEGLLVYRLNNGRTRVAQLQYLNKMHFPSNFFVGKQENISAQHAQHEILLELAKDPKADIYDELKLIKMQREPLLATRSGIVVNGNRRLAAMRDLAKDAKTYGMFSHVDVAILPEGATEEDIEDIETDLQEVPQMRLEYTWIDRRLKIRYQLEDLGLTAEALRVKYRLRSAEDVNRELQQLALAEEYLVYAGEPRTHYWKVAKGEEIFKRLQQALSKSTPERLELRRLVGFSLIAAGGSIEDRLYRYHPMFGQQLDKMVNRYERECPPPEVSEPAIDVSASDDPLAELAKDVQLLPGSSLIKKLKNVAEARETAKTLTRMFDDLEREEKEGSRRRVGLLNSQEALRLLTEIDISQVSLSDAEAFKSTIASIRERAEALAASFLK